MTPKVVCIIQARMASRRFPGKVLEQIKGLEVIRHVFRRVEQTGYETTVAVALTEKDDAGPLLSLVDVQKDAIEMPEDDVLGRYAACARECEADVVVRITGDCPLVDPVAIQGQVKRLLDTGAMYVSNIYPVRTVPSGFDVEVFTATALYVADALATWAHDREHVTPWIQRMFCVQASNDVPLPHLSLDTPEDLALIRQVAEKMP